MMEQMQVRQFSIIPRRNKKMTDPMEGIRQTIPRKGFYTK
jgi:hypothetical protein